MLKEKESLRNQDEEEIPAVKHGIHVEKGHADLE